MNTAPITAAPIGLTHFLVVAAVLFTLGLITVATRRSAVAIQMGIELILNAAAINFVAFAHYSHGAVTGQVFAVFVVVLAAAEATVALAIVLAVYRGHGTIDVTDLQSLKD